MLSFEQARSWYPQDDPVHGFDHVVRVYRLAEQLAQSEGADWQVVKAAVLLHDAQMNETGATVDSDADNAHLNRRDTHHLHSTELAARILKAEGWSPEKISAVQHCIRAHRFRDDSASPQTLEARVLFDADKLDAIGAIGVARAIAYAVRAGCPFYHPPSATFLETGWLEPDEPHSAYHEYLFKLVKIKDRLTTESGKRLAVDRQLRMVDFFEGLADEMGGVISPI